MGKYKSVNTGDCKAMASAETKQKEALRKMIQDCTDAGNEVIFNSAYRSIDTGTPVIISNKKSPLSQAYASIAELL